MPVTTSTFSHPFSCAYQHTPHHPSGVHRPLNRFVHLHLGEGTLSPPTPRGEVETESLLFLVFMQKQCICLSIFKSAHTNTQRERWSSHQGTTAWRFWQGLCWRQRGKRRDPCYHGTYHVYLYIHVAHRPASFCIFTCTHSHIHREGHTTPSGGPSMGKEEREGSEWKVGKLGE